MMKNITTMTTRASLLLAAYWYLSLLPYNYGFVSVVPSPMLLSKTTRVNRGRTMRTTTTALPVGLSLDQLKEDDNAHHPKNDELYYRYMIAKAKEVAYSDTSSAIDAQHFLQRILELESRCIGGLINGHELCDNVDEMADVVSHLRHRVTVGQLQEDNIEEQRKAGAAALVAMSLFPLSLLALLLTMVVASTIDWKTGAIPFTMEEWIMATRGGYLHTMIDHYIRNGGL